MPLKIIRIQPRVSSVLGSATPQRQKVASVLGAYTQNLNSLKSPNFAE